MPDAALFFPGADLRRKKDHGRAEALLLAWWAQQREGRRRQVMDVTTLERAVTTLLQQGKPVSVRNVQWPAGPPAPPASAPPAPAAARQAAEPCPAALAPAACPDCAMAQAALRRVREDLAAACVLAKLPAELRVRFAQARAVFPENSQASLLAALLCSILAQRGAQTGAVRPSPARSQ